MNNIQIGENFDYTSNEKIKLYKDIFWENPWNEWFICKNCWKIYNIKFMWTCSCNQSKLEPFYKNSEIKETFAQLSEKLWYKELIAKVLNNEVWFIWWWQTSLEQLNTDKLWLNEEQISVLIKQINALFSDFNFENFYYFAEIWVKNDYRWQDIAWELYRQNLEQIKSNWVNYILVRTTKKTDVPYKWFLKEWYKDVYSYNDEQDRVILALKI